MKKLVRGKFCVVIELDEMARVGDRLSLRNVPPALRDDDDRQRELVIKVNAHRLLTVRYSGYDWNYITKTNYAIRNYGGNLCLEELDSEVRPLRVFKEEERMLDKGVSS